MAGKLEYDKVSIGNLKKYLKKEGIAFEQLNIDLEEFENYLALAKYDRWPDYYSEFPSEIRREKYFQHYISIKLLGIKEDDVFIDIGSNISPVKDIVREIYQAKTYSLDISYEPGIHGDRIGSDAGNTGLPEAFASKLSLHCSFEHFENDTDINFIKEASRILSPGGKICIVPLYLYDKFVIHQDPTLECDIKVKNKGGAKIRYVKNYNVSFGRFYSLESLKQRIFYNCNNLIPKVYCIENIKEISTVAHSRFLLILEKIEK
jgi:SAM-dependent methyltransferase